jgi:hypothetical protein
MIFSVAKSKALVASSNNNILGSFKIALAIAILYFYPPDIYSPYLPQYVSNFSLNFDINSHAYAFLHALIISSSEASGFASFKLSLIEASNRTGS